MKFSRIARTALAAATSLAVGLGTVACSRDYTVAYVYATSASNGTVSAFGVDYQSGVLTQISGSPFPTNVGNNLTTLVPSPNGKFLYVIGGTQSAAVEEISVGTDGKLYGQHTYSLTGTYPTAAAIDSTGTFLYVTFTYQAGFTPASGGPGGMSVFPINADNSLGTPFTVKLGVNPVAVTVSVTSCTPTPANGAGGNPACTGPQGAGKLNSFVYVVDQETAPNASVLGFVQNMTTGGLTPITPTASPVCSPTAPTICGFRAGVTPSGVAVDPTSTYMYVTDKAQNQILGYQIAYTTTGAVTPLTSSPYTTGQLPVSITIDPRGKYVYTANYNSNTVGSYTLNKADGSLGGSAGVGNFTTATGPTCVSVDPALGIYLYTSNYLDGSVSGGQLNPNTGQLNAIQDTPYPSGALPSCVTVVANGEHSNSIVQR